MKIYGFIVVLLVVAVVAMAAPKPSIEGFSELLDELDAASTDLGEFEEEPQRADRQRRVTCDLLSFKGIAEHSACAANCLSMGKAGGRCENGVCVCRKTTFAELWKKRFG